jgi:hypothetical protein
VIPGRRTAIFSDPGIHVSALADSIRDDRLVSELYAKYSSVCLQIFSPRSHVRSLPWLSGARPTQPARVLSTRGHLCRTLALTCCRKRERSGRWRQSGAALG